MSNANYNMEWNQVQSYYNIFIAIVFFPAVDVNLTGSKTSYPSDNIIFIDIAPS